MHLLDIVTMTLAQADGAADGAADAGVQSVKKAEFDRVKRLAGLR